MNLFNNKHSRLVKNVLFTNILSLFVRRKCSNTIIFNSVANSSYNFNSKYLFEYILRNFSEEFNVKFVINDNQLRAHLISEIGDYFISSNNIKDMKLILQSKIWVTSSLDAPVEYPLIKHKERVFYHMGHGVPLKNMVFAENKISFIKWLNRYLRVRLFTHVLCYSEEFKPIMEKTFLNKSIQYVPLGQPRNDALSEYGYVHLKNIIENKLGISLENQKTILYSPTWRPYTNVKFFPFENLEPMELNRLLIQYNIILFLRKHPYFDCEIDEEFLKQSNIYWFNSEEFTDINMFLPFFDKLLTDYSSIFLDYLPMNKPIGFIPYDIDKYKENVGFTGEELFCGDFINNSEDFVDFLVQDNDKYKSDRDKVMEVTNTKKGGNCIENFTFLRQFIDK